MACVVTALEGSKMRVVAETGTWVVRRVATPRHAVALMIAMLGLLLHLMTKSDLMAVALIAPVLVLLLPLPAGVGRSDQPQTGQLSGIDLVEAELDGRIAADDRIRPGILALAPVPVGPDAPASRQDVIVARDAIATLLRPEDTIAAAEDGTIFVAVAARGDASRERLIQLALRLQKRLRNPCQGDTGTVTFTTCVGLGPGDEAAASMGARYCLLEARRALDLARRRGPAEIALPDDRDGQAANDGVRLALDLDLALRSGQLVPFFQPQVSCETGALVGLEALARWNHPQLGLLPPGRFMPTIEAAGADRALTETVLLQTLDQIAAWDADGLHVPRVSINVTRDDLSDPVFPGKVADAIGTAGVSPERLGIEVLETVLSTTDDTRIPDTLGTLSDLGCKIDLDDFGTGQSSIASIRRFRVDKLKIDRSFVSGVDHDPEQSNMVAAMVTMADQLNLEVLAEGVENDAERARIAELGCDAVQGYGVGRPMAADDLRGWLDRWNARGATSLRGETVATIAGRGQARATVAA